MAILSPPSGWSIRAKSVALGVGYLLVLSAVYSAFSVYLVRREMSEAHSRFLQTARIVAAQLDAYVDSGAYRLQMVARLPGLAYGLQTIQETGGSGYIPPWTTLHYLFFKSQVFTGGVLLLDRAGKVVWTEPPGLPWLGQTLNDVEPVSAIYRTRRSVMSAALGADHLSAQHHVVLAEPIQSENGELQGVLAGVIDLAASQVGEILGAVSTTAGRFVEVVDQRGIVLAATNPVRLFQPAESATPAEERPLLASVSLTHAPWRIVAGQPRSLGLAGVREFQRALLGIGVVLLLAAGAVAAPILNAFVRAIRQLTDAAETVGRGDLSQPVPVPRRRDELATLAGAFEQMRVDLERSRRSLEQRLAEREELIRLLVRTNEELQGTQARLIDAERFAAIGELSAAVAHGIRNPLAGIMAAAQVAALDLPDSHPLHENIRDIITETGKLEARIKTLLNFAKPFEPHMAPCRPERIVADAVASLRSQLTEHGIDLVVAVPPTLPDAELDYAQIEQVLLALLSNAVEAMPHGGRITVTGGVTADGQRLRLEVTDTGPGIPADKLDRIFALFFTTKSSGTGLGLAVAKTIVQRHGGTIAVASDVGKGTEVAIELPLSRRWPAAPGGPPDAAAAT